MDKLLVNLYRLTFATAFLLVTQAVVEGVVQLFGYSLLRGTYTAGRLMEFGGILMVFVIALLLRNIRNK